MTRSDEIHLREQDEEFDFLFKEANAHEPEQTAEQAPEATIHGDLANVELSDIFQTITMSRMTGTLLVHTGGRETAVHFEAGRIRVAPPLDTWLRRISRRLVASGLCEARALRSCLVQVAREEADLGTVLAEQTGLDPDRYYTVQAALEEDSLLELFTNRKGQCTFYRDNYYSSKYQERFAQSIPFEADQLLFEVARKSDEWRLILHELGSLNEIFVPVQPYDEQGCDEVQLELLRLLDGTQTLSDVAGAMLDSLFDVAKAAQSLRLKGKITKVSTQHLIGLAKAEVLSQHEARAHWFLNLIHELRTPSETQEWIEIAEVYKELDKPRPAAAALCNAAQRTESREAKKDLLRRAHRLDNLNTRILEHLYLMLADEPYADVEEEYVRVLEKLASCHESNDDFAKALELLEELAEHQPRSAAVAGRRAKMLVRLRREGEALQLLRWIAESMRTEKQIAGYGHVLEQILKIAPDDGAARKELQRIRSRIDPRLVRLGIVLMIALLVGSVGWSFYASWADKAAASERLQEAEQLFAANRHEEAEEIVEELALTYRDDDLGAAAGELLGTIRRIRREAEALVLKEAQNELFSGLDRAADDFEHGRWKESLQTFVELTHGIAKTRKDYATKVSEAVHARFGVLAQEIEKHLMVHQQHPLPTEDLLRSPQQRRDALALLDEYYPKEKCTAYLDLSGALEADARFTQLEGLPPKLLENVEKWSRIAEHALEIRTELEAELANDRKKVGIDQAFSDAEKARHAFDFVTALRLYELIVRDYEGEPKLERRFREQRDLLARAVALEQEIESACAKGDFRTARLGLTGLQRTFPDLDFAPRVALPLRVESRPQGARIFVDDELVGETPRILRLTPDRDRRLRIERRGFRTADLALPKEHDGEVVVSFELEPTWQEKEAGAITRTPLVAARLGLALITDRSGRLVARDLRTGALRWERRFPGLSGDLGTLLQREDRLLLPGREGALRCLDIATGKTIWELELDEALLSPAILAGNEIWVASESGRIHRIAPNGTARGEPLRAEAPFATGLAAHGDRVFALERTGRVLAFDVEGKLLWHTAIVDAGLIPFAVSEHGVVVPSGLGQLHVLDVRDGSELAALEVGDTLRRGVHCAGRYALLTNGSRELVAIELVQRKVRWRRPIPVLSSAAPSVIGSKVLVALRERGVRVYDLADGSERFCMADGSTVEVAIPGGAGAPLLVAAASGQVWAYPDEALELR